MPEMRRLGDGLQVFCEPIDVQDTLALRHSVLWPTKDLSHVQLAEDEIGVHLGAFIEKPNSKRKTPVAVISIFYEDIPSHSMLGVNGTDTQSSDLSMTPQTSCCTVTSPTTTTIRFRKFACDLDYQNQGIGSRLLEYAIFYARKSMNGSLLWCDARTSALGWYTKRGLKRFGQTFHKGPVEYVRMKTTLDSAGYDDDETETMM